MREGINIKPSSLANKTTIHMEAINKGTKDVEGGTSLMTSSTEWFVTGMCCILGNFAYPAKIGY
jgi:hypothetical protein